MQRKFAPMLNQVSACKEHDLADATAKLIIYRALSEEDLDVPKHLADDVHRNYFEPEYDEFKPRMMWSLECIYVGAEGGAGPDSAISSDGSSCTVSGRAFQSH